MQCAVSTQCNRVLILWVPCTAVNWSSRIRMAAAASHGRQPRKWTETIEVLLAALGFLNPLIAAIIHVSSELAFILNSARLLPSRRA